MALQRETGTGLRGIAPARLRRRCALAGAGFATTDDLKDAEGTFGQARAVEAIRFGVAIRAEGYNLYAMGPEGHGRHATVRRLLEERASAEAVPADWCYVFNFDTPHKPSRLELPAGRAQSLAQDMRQFVEDLQAGIPAAFETDEYRARMQEIETAFSERQEKAIGAVGDKARKEGIALLRTPSGFGFAPMHENAVMEPDRFRALAEAEQQRIQEAIAKLQAELEAVIQEMPKWRREAQRQVRDVNRQVTHTAVNGLMNELSGTWGDLPQVQEYLRRVKADVLDHAEFFRQPKEGENPTLLGIPIRVEAGETPLKRYQVNVLVEHPANHGAPVVIEDNPTHANLVGRIEHVSQMGTLLTDFTLIKSGALHRANGGYLVLDAMKALTQPLAWEALKRALRSREARIESLAQALGFISTVSLEPEPVPLELKVVLVGDRRLYYLLYEYDPEFRDLFKIAADFEEDTARADEGELAHARMIATLARAEKLRPFSRDAVERIIEYGARSAADAEKLSLSLRGIADLLRETEQFAKVAGRAVASAEEVSQALAARERRHDRVRERLRETTLRETLLVSTSGERIGQVNALAVLSLGSFAFGAPHRVTARVRLGSGKVVDIERESELGGPIHSKGVLILSGYLSGRYAARHPLSLSASLVFEQSYSGVEGDSASSAELYALLSAIAEVPLRQSYAVTGSVNQHGDVQAVGGVNEKVEGFFDLCRSRGLDGTQGVLIPAANERHLMLREDLVQAAAEGKFAVIPVETIDQGLELLTGLPAGEVNRRVENRLVEYSARARAPGADARERTWRARRRK